MTDTASAASSLTKVERTKQAITISTKETLLTGGLPVGPAPGAPRQVIEDLEVLAHQPARVVEFRQALVRAFLEQPTAELKQAHLQEGLRSRDEKVRDIARSLSFLNQVAEQGFRQALDEVEETLFSDGHEGDLLDFIADEVAPHDRPTTLDWLHEQGPDLWEDALPLVLGDWAVDAPSEVGTWIQTLESGDFRDRAIAEYVPALARNGQGFSENLVNQIGDEDIRQEARIRTGEISFSVLAEN